MKLAEIDGQTLARDTVAAAMRRVCSTLFAIVPFSDFRLVNGSGRAIDDPAQHDPTQSTAGQSILQLVQYAQTGRGLHGESVEEYCTTLIPVAVDALDDAGQPDPSTPLGLVVAAAFGRERLAANKSIKTPALAALGGVTPQWLRQLVDGGELERVGHGEYAAASAVRWLEARGVPGFGRRS